MSSKKVNLQVNKAVQLILKEHWEKDIAIEVCFTSVADKIDYTTYYSMVLDKLEGKGVLMIKDEQRIKSVLKDFRVKDEKQFYSFINNTWNFSNCTKCNRTINLLYCDFDNGNPICKDGSCVI